MLLYPWLIQRCNLSALGSSPSGAAPDHVSEGLSGLGILICLCVMLGIATAALSRHTRHTVGRLHLPSGGTGLPLVSALAMAVNLKPQVVMRLSDRTKSGIKEN